MTVRRHMTPLFSTTAPPESGVVAIVGPAGNAQRINVSVADTPESIEHCLRAIFRIRQITGFVLRYTPNGCAMPLGPGLLLQPGADGTGPHGVVYRLEADEDTQQDASRADHSALLSGRSGTLTFTELNHVRLDDHAPRHLQVPGAPGKLSKYCFHDTCRCDVLDGSQSPLPGNVEEDPAPPVADVRSFGSIISMPDSLYEGTGQAHEELNFWCDLAVGFLGTSGHSCIRNSSYSSFSHDDSPAEEFLRSAAFDCSDQRIDNLFREWTRKHRLTQRRLRSYLKSEYGLSLNKDLLAQALSKCIRPSDEEDDAQGHSTVQSSDDLEVCFDLFMPFWQRLMLGAACRRTELVSSANLEQLQLVEYSDHIFETEFMHEEELLFRTPLVVRRRISTPAVAQPHDVAHWVRADSATPERLLRLGVKFYLHPLATCDAITMAKIGMTKVDYYKHQYFVSLQVHVLKSRLIGRAYRLTNESGRATTTDEEPPMVGPNVMRSDIFIVSTGNPRGHTRDWLISMVGQSPEKGIKDPLDFYRFDRAAATKILNDVHADLEAHGRLREYTADFLLYTIIDRAASESTPILLAYGHRIKWLQKLLNEEKLQLPGKYVDEVLKMRLELQELRQWVGQTKGILKTLSADARNIKRTDFDNASWNFGANLEGKGKSILLFLSNTDGHLDQMMDRLTMLDELAKNFLDCHHRHREGFLNTILLVLTVATAIFMPAQLLAGIYGTNFVREDGTPAIPELRWEHGYLFFIMSAVAIILLGLLLAVCYLRR